MFGIFSKKDPVCGMKEEKGKGVSSNGKWFCSNNCLKKYEKEMKTMEKKHGGCCH